MDENGLQMPGNNHLCSKVVTKMLLANKKLDRKPYAIGARTEKPLGRRGAQKRAKFL